MKLPSNIWILILFHYFVVSSLGDLSIPKMSHDLNKILEMSSFHNTFNDTQKSEMKW